jgi:hypothetical protein
MKNGRPLLLGLVLAALAIVLVDVLYVSRFVPRFKEIERQRIVLSNQLATAKIVSENLDHVRDLVFRNIQFPGQKDSVSQQSLMFEFLTESVNDLKMRILSVRPSPPVSEGQVTTYGYDLEIEGDFFSLGELFAKLENSRRAMAVTAFEVSLQKAPAVPAAGPGPGPGPGLKAPPAPRRPVLIRMHLETYRLRKV